MISDNFWVSIRELRIALRSFINLLLSFVWICRIPIKRLTTHQNGALVAMAA